MARVVDGGRQMEVLGAGTAESVRLHGIELPPRGSVFGAAAESLIKKLVLHKEVLVVTDGKALRGQTAAQVTFDRGRNLAQELLAAGLARWDRAQSPGELTLQRLEDEARTQRRGLWGAVRDVDEGQR